MIVSSRSIDKRKVALKLGADFAIDTHTEWFNVLKDETINLVIDSLGEAIFNKSLSVLKHGGNLVVFVAMASDEISLNIR